MRKIILDRADRLQRMPPEFVHLDRLAARLDRRQVHIIDLSRIDCTPVPDLTPPAPSLGDLISAPDETTWRSLCEAITRLYETRYGAGLDPQTEVLLVSGTATAVNLLGLAFVDPGEMILAPDPGLPMYRHAAALCGGGVQTYYLYDRNNYIPDCRTIAESLAGKTKLWILGYPHNPTTALADRDLITEVTRLARRHNILIVHDASLALLIDRGAEDTGLLANVHARSVGVEVLSFACNFGLGELPLAAVVGNREAVAGVRFLAESMRLMPSRGMLKIGCWILENAERLVEHRRRRCAQAYRTLVGALDKLGWSSRWSESLPYCWVTLPGRYSSLGFARRLLRRAGIKVAPGTMFGEQGEGYARISLLSDPEVMETIAERLLEFERAWPKRRRRRNERAE